MPFRAKEAMSCFALMLLVGCAPPETPTGSALNSSPTNEAVEPPESTAPPKPETPTDAEPVSVRSAFTYDKNLNRAMLDTQVAPPQKQTFWLGLGSVTIETVSAQKGVLTIRHTVEIEGGYSVSECEVDISPTPLVFQFASDGTPGQTPDALRNCKPIRSGNVHLDPSNINVEKGD